MDLNQIQELIKFVSKSGVTEVEIEKKDFKIIIRSEGKKGRKGAREEQQVFIQQPQMPVAAMPPQAAPQQAPAPQAAPAQEAKKEEPKEDESKYVTVKSPMIGTFYRSPSPDKPPFVAVGDTIKTGDVTCIIEAMKLFNEIESEINGKIVKVLVDDATPVEYDQPLFLVDPS